jgi:hypothetical protein
MATKISIFKTTADGEQVNVEIDLTADHLKQMEPRHVKHPNNRDEIVPGKSLRELFQPCFQLVDDRLFEMNQRIMASNVLVKKLPPEAQYAVHNVFEVLHGRSQGPAPAEILEEARRERDAAAAALAKTKQDLPE